MDGVELAAGGVAGQRGAGGPEHGDDQVRFWNTFSGWKYSRPLLPRDSPLMAV
jgi:hypothetical protein